MTFSYLKAGRSWLPQCLTCSCVLEQPLIASRDPEIPDSSGPPMAYRARRLSSRAEGIKPIRPITNVPLSGTALGANTRPKGLVTDANVLWVPVGSNFKMVKIGRAHV